MFLASTWFLGLTRDGTAVGVGVRPAASGLACAAAMLGNLVLSARKPIFVDKG